MRKSGYGKSVPIGRKVTEYPKRKSANLVVDPFPARKPQLNPVPARKPKKK